LQKKQEKKPRTIMPPKQGKKPTQVHAGNEVEVEVELCSRLYYIIVYIMFNMNRMFVCDKVNRPYDISRVEAGNAPPSLPCGRTNEGVENVIEYKGDKYRVVGDCKNFPGTSCIHLNNDNCEGKKFTVYKIIPNIPTVVCIPKPRSLSELGNTTTAPTAITAPTKTIATIENSVQTTEVRQNDPYASGPKVELIYVWTLLTEYSDQYVSEFVKLSKMVNKEFPEIGIFSDVIKGTFTFHINHENIDRFQAFIAISRVVPKPYLLCDQCCKGCPTIEHVCANHSREIEWFSLKVTTQVK